MTDATTTLIASIAGILGTLISSSLGLYFVARARTSPLRELLYAKQIETVLDILHLFGRAKNFVILVADPEGPHRDRAFQDLVKLVHELGRHEDRAAAILPTELYAEVTAVQRTLLNLLEAAEAKANTTPHADAFAVHTTKGVLLSRIFLGVDELSQESLKLFARSADVDRIAALPPEDILTLRGRSSE